MASRTKTRTKAAKAPKKAPKTRPAKPAKARPEPAPAPHPEPEPAPTVHPKPVLEHDQATPPEPRLEARRITNDPPPPVRRASRPPQLNVRLSPALIDRVRRCAEDADYHGGAPVTIAGVVQRALYLYLKVYEEQVPAPARGR